MLERFKKLQEAIRAEQDRYNIKRLMFEEEDYIHLSPYIDIVGVSMIENSVEIEVNGSENAFLGLSWLSDLAISKVVDTLVTYVK